MSLRQRARELNERLGPFVCRGAPNPEKSFRLVQALSLPLGSLFFVLVQYITRASWSVTVRRVAELFMRTMPIFAVLVIPLVLTIGQLFPWLGAKHHVAEADATVQLAYLGEEL